jgi:hypothetical protein
MRRNVTLFRPDAMRTDVRPISAALPSDLQDQVRKRVRMLAGLLLLSFSLDRRGGRLLRRCRRSGPGFLRNRAQERRLERLPWPASAKTHTGTRSSRRFTPTRAGTGSQPRQAGSRPRGRPWRRRSKACPDRGDPPEGASRSAGPCGIGIERVWSPSLEKGPLPVQARARQARARPRDPPGQAAPPSFIWHRALTVALLTATVSAAEWPQWRGTAGDRGLEREGPSGDLDREGHLLEVGARGCGRVFAGRLGRPRLRHLANRPGGATPAISNGQIFMRTDRHLVAVGKPRA